MRLCIVRNTFQKAVRSHWNELSTSYVVSSQHQASRDAIIIGNFYEYVPYFVMLDRKEGKKRIFFLTVDVSLRGIFRISTLTLPKRKTRARIVPYDIDHIGIEYLGIAKQRVDVQIRPLQILNFVEGEGVATHLWRRIFANIIR